MKLSTRNVEAIGQAIASREAFQCYGSLSATRYWNGNVGILPDQYVLQMEDKHVDYVVFSYGTPIAWHTDNGWTVPDVKYSVTTSKHQGTIRRALSVNV